MKKFLIFVSALLAFAACTKDNGETSGPPSLSEVRNATGVVTSAARGSGVQLVGENLADLTSVKFNGVDADLGTAVLTGKMVAVIIPADTPLSGSDEIEVANPHGSAKIAFVILPGTPTLTDISNLFPLEGERITLTGTDLLMVKAVLFPGSPAIEVTDFTANSAGTEVAVTVPQGFDASKGAIMVVTQSGNASLNPVTPEPVITGMENESGEGIEYASKGDIISLLGEDLAHANNAGFLVSVKINGTEVSKASITATAEKLTFAIPDGVPVIPAVAATDKIVVETIGGVVEADFIVLPSQPTIVRMNNPWPAAGEEVTIFGTDLFYVRSIELPGLATLVEEPDMDLAPDGTSVTFTVPAGFVPSHADLELTALSGVATFSLTEPMPFITGVSDISGAPVTYGYKGTTINVEGTFLDAATSLVVNDKTFAIPDPAITVTETSVSFTIPQDTKTRVDDISIVPQEKLNYDGGDTSFPFYVMPYKPVGISDLKFEAEGGWSDTPWQVRPNFQVGADPYVDRVSLTNPISKISSVAYEGTVLIATTVDGRAFTAEGALASFIIDRDAEIIVMYSYGGMKSIPAWLLEDKGWSVDDPSVWEMGDGGAEPNREQFGTLNMNISERFYAFRKTFTAGSRVELFRNSENAGAGNNTNRSPYFVLVK
jgi:hypothetical protein